jgi:hypothetical protein
LTPHTGLVGEVGTAHLPPQINHTLRRDQDE